MRLAEALEPFLPPVAGGAVTALVGAGGKTSALFCLAAELMDAGTRVLVTTTTHIHDPRHEAGRPPLRVRLESAWAGPEAPSPGAEAPAWCTAVPPGQLLVLAAREMSGQAKLVGIHPSRVDRLARPGFHILVEADGSKGRPVKAPADHEPVVPDRAGLVLGLVGLGCLGRPMDERTVHRPERFAQVTGCAWGAAIGWDHLAALVGDPRGLFKGAPRRSRRVLLLNQADLAGEGPETLLQRLGLEACRCCEAVLVCRLNQRDPWRKVELRNILAGDGAVPL